MKLFFRALALAALAGAASPLWSQATEIQYDHHLAGDRALTIQLGPALPIAFQTFGGQFSSTGLTWGGTLGVNLDFYLNDWLRFGAGLSGMAASDVNNNTLFMVPVTFRTTWEPKISHFSFPMTLGAGFTFTSHLSASTFDPTLIPSVGAFWNMSSSWSFGVNSCTWIVFQPYFSGGTVPVSDSRIGYFTDLTAAVIYHF